MAEHKDPVSVKESTEPLESAAKEELSAALEDLDNLEKGGGRQWIDHTLKALKKKLGGLQAKLTLQSNEASAALRKAGLADKIKAMTERVSAAGARANSLSTKAEPLQKLSDLSEQNAKALAD